MRNFQKRFGNFMIMVGAVLFVFFFLSDYLGKAEIWYLVFAVVLLGLGSSLAWRGREEPGPSGRFRMLRRLSGGDKGSGGGKDDDDKDDSKDR